MRLVLRAFFFCFLLLTVVVGPAQAQTTGTQVSTKADEKGKKKKEVGKSTNPTLQNITGGGSGWRLQGSLSHVPKLRRDQEDYTDILTRADYTFNKKHRVRIQQSWTKIYGKYESEYEFKADDTVLAHYYSPEIDFLKRNKVNVLWRNHLTVPISNASVRDDLITRFQTSLIGTKGFLGGKLIGFFIPYANYHWYEFNMSPSGQRLPWMTFGASAAALYFFTPKFTLYGGALYNYQMTRSSQFEDSPTQINSGTYRFDVSMAYQFTPEWSTSLSYFQGANYTRDGRYELVFFDDQVSRVSLDVSFIY